MDNRIYLCIDLKSFYASVECVERGLDPLTTNLVVADGARTEKTICLAVTPSLKSLGFSSRARLFEVIQKTKEINNNKMKKYGKLIGKSYNIEELKKHPQMELDYIVAPPQMAHYISISSKIYEIYLQFVSSEDIHVYSIDEVFIDVTNYLNSYKMTAYELAYKIIRAVLKETHITATAGIGPNMYLAKVAMDIMAKKIEADTDGVRIAQIDEKSYRENLWLHQPLTDFWRIGRGYIKKLEANGMHTMGDIALCSLKNEDLLYKLFGVNAELLIDHAWGYESCTIADIKSYKPQGKSLGSGQVLHAPYDFDKTRLIVKEMVDALALDLVDNGLVTKQLVITIGYDIENITNSKIKYNGDVTTDYLGRTIPKHAHGTVNLKRYTSSSKLLTQAVLEKYDQIVDRNLLIRRINIASTNLRNENVKINEYEQLDLFNDNSNDKLNNELEKEKKTQQVILDIKKKFGKNAIIKGMSLEEGATMKDRNKQIGGHKA